MSVSPGQNGTSPSRRSITSSSSSRRTSARASAAASEPARTRAAAASNSLTPVRGSAPVAEVLLVLLGRRGERGIGVELRLHLLPRRGPLGRDVLGGPVALVGS